MGSKWHLQFSLPPPILAYQIVQAGLLFEQQNCPTTGHKAIAQACKSGAARHPGKHVLHSAEAWLNSHPAVLQVKIRASGMSTQSWWVVAQIAWSVETLVD